MEIVAFNKSGKISLQVVRRTHDIAWGKTKSSPGYTADILWESTNRKFRYRPTINTCEEKMAYGETHVLVVLDSVEKESVALLLTKEEIRNKLELRGFYST